MKKKNLCIYNRVLDDLMRYLYKGRMLSEFKAFCVYSEFEIMQFHKSDAIM